MNTQKLRELAEYIINSRLDNTASPQQRWKKEDEYIAAACPANILALLERNKALENVRLAAENYLDKRPDVGAYLNLEAALAECKAIAKAGSHD